MSLAELRREIKKQSNAEHAKAMQWFFKTGKGEYGEGDIFVGIKVPVQRKIAKKFIELNYNDLQELLNSPVHEERLIALLILVEKYSKAEEDGKITVYNFWLKNIKRINNWDLVDLSAPKILGAHLQNGDKELLFKLANSKNLWERRIAIVTTYSFIKAGNLIITFEIAKLLLNDEHDLIHKAVGWMLREAGKIDRDMLEDFLKPRYKKIPRTMLRYSIEKFPEDLRQKYLKGMV